MEIFSEPLCAVGRAYSNAYFGAGGGQIFLDDVQCTSTSTQLLECLSRPILSHNCLHSADAGVRCEGIVYKLFLKICYLTRLSNAYRSMYDWPATINGR